MLRRRAQLLRAFLAARLRIHAHHRLSSRQAVTDPRPVAEQQLQSVSTDNLVHRAPAELPRIKPQLLSELLLHLWRQAEVLAPREIGTYLVIYGLQLLAHGLASARHRFATQQPGQYAIFFWNVMPNRQPGTFFAADRDLILHNQF